MFRLLVLGFACGLLLFPAASLEGARRGLILWADTLLPALFPATVAALLLVRLDLLRPVGKVLEPLMRPLFGLPGHAGLALAMSASSGYLMGAVVAGELRRAGILDRGEAEKLLSLATLANPLFLSGAVAVGMFERPELGGLLLAAHYLGALFLGLLFRFWESGWGAGGGGGGVPVPRAVRAGAHFRPLVPPVADKRGFSHPAPRLRPGAGWAGCGSGGGEPGPGGAAAGDPGAGRVSERVIGVAPVSRRVMGAAPGSGRVIGATPGSGSRVTGALPARGRAMAGAAGEPGPKAASGGDAVVGAPQAGRSAADTPVAGKVTDTSSGEAAAGVPGRGQNPAGARVPDGTHWAGIFREAVERGTKTLLLAGGVVTVFSSFLAVIESAGMERWLAGPVSLALGFLGFDPRAGEAVVQGGFEVTLGAEALSQLPIPLWQRAALASGLAGWGGLSVLAQVAALVHGTDISLRPYLLARFLHALFAGAFFIILAAGLELG